MIKILNIKEKGKLVLVQYHASIAIYFNNDPQTV